MFVRLKGKAGFVWRKKVRAKSGYIPIKLKEDQMSLENVEKFYAKMGEEKELREKVSKAGERLKDQFKTKEELKEKAPAEIYRVLEPLAREAGCPFTLAEMEAYQKEKGRQLTDTQLDAVAGGASCGCVFGGGGSGDPLACAFYGQSTKCICPLVGAGV
jgi:hypothetical protein